jgi:hypothetical protein
MLGLLQLLATVFGGKAMVAAGRLDHHVSADHHACHASLN